MNSACIILAAGKSQRFGASKMLHRLANDKSILEQTVSQYSAHFSALTVVLNENQAHLEELLDQMKSLQVEVVLSKWADLGMSQSLIAGLQQHEEATSIMIALGDMPYISAETIGQLSSAMSANQIVLPRYQGMLGNPVSFGQRFFAELGQLTGDQGGKKIVNAHADSVVLVDVDDQGVLLDIDTPEQIRPA